MREGVRLNEGWEVQAGKLTVPFPSRSIESTGSFHLVSELADIAAFPARIAAFNLPQVPVPINATKTASFAVSCLVLPVLLYSSFAQVVSAVVCRIAIAVINGTIWPSSMR